MDRRFLNKKELSEYLGVAEGTLAVWVCHRKIPYVKVGRLVKFDIKRIDSWTAENAVDVAV
jgi:excisionase family DNA binding protein